MAKRIHGRHTHTHTRIGKMRRVGECGKRGERRAEKAKAKRVKTQDNADKSGNNDNNKHGQERQQQPQQQKASRCALLLALLLYHLLAMHSCFLLFFGFSVFLVGFLLLLFFFFFGKLESLPAAFGVFLPLLKCARAFPTTKRKQTTSETHKVALYRTKKKVECANTPAPKKKKKNNS